MWHSVAAALSAEAGIQFPSGLCIPGDDAAGPIVIGKSTGCKYGYYDNSDNSNGSNQTDNRQGHGPWTMIVNVNGKYVHVV